MKKYFLSTSIVFISSLVFSQQKPKDTVQNIKGVIINAPKKLITKKVDRLVYNVEKSIASQGSDAVEALANTPLIKVDENFNIISIAGKGAVSVMVNDRMLNLSGNDLMNYLKSIRSNNISKIEVITTPPAKYEAQGNSGIINIILKKNPNMGWSGSLGSTLIQRTYTGVSDDATLNFQNEKINATFNLSYYNSAKRSVENYSIIGITESAIQHTVRKDMGKTLSPNLSFNFKLSKKSDIGFIYNLGNWDGGMDILNNSDYYNQNSLYQTLVTNTTHREKNPSQTLNTYYELKIDSLGKKLSLGANYYTTKNTTNVDFSTVNLKANSEVETVKTFSEINPTIFSAQADLSLPYKFVNIETGAKFNAFKNSADLKYFNLISNSYVLQENRSNVFNYDEKNYALYLSLSKDFNEKWSAKAGLRYEDAFVNAYSPQNSDEIKYSYGKLFPSFYLTYKPNTHHTFSFNYSKRIDRPSMWSLNPFKWYSNPYSYSSGNPLLQPSYNHNFELGYVFKNSLSFTFYFQRLLNGYSQYSHLDGLQAISTYANYYNQNSLGLSVNYAKNFYKWWEANMSLNGYLTKSTVFNIDAVGQKGQGFDYSVYNTFTLNKAKSLFFLLNFSQSLPSRSNNSYIHTFTDLNSGLKMSLMEKKLQINLVVSNILAQKYSGDLFFENNTQHFNNYWDGRHLKLSVLYTFGNDKVSGANKQVDFDEKNRVK